MDGGLDRIFAALNAADVRYLIVGGVAVVLHGHLRTTADLHLVVQLEAENVTRALEALRTLGFRPRNPVALGDFADPDLRARWREEMGMVAFSLWSKRMPGTGVDLLTEEPPDFREVYERALRVDLDTTHATVIGLEDLMAMKRQSGRTRDLEDVVALEALLPEDEDDA